MRKDSVPPKNPEYIADDDGATTHYCGRCGREHQLGEFASSLSPCCSYPCYPLAAGPVSALPGKPDSPAAVAFLLSRTWLGDRDLGRPH